MVPSRHKFKPRLIWSPLLFELWCLKGRARLLEQAAKHKPEAASTHLFLASGLACPDPAFDWALLFEPTRPRTAPLLGPENHKIQWHKSVTGNHSSEANHQKPINTSQSSEATYQKSVTGLERTTIDDKVAVVTQNPVLSRHRRDGLADPENPTCELRQMGIQPNINHFCLINVLFL